MINKIENLVFNELRQMGFDPKKCDELGYPDFKLNDKLWVEVKNDNWKGGDKLSSKQEEKFKELIEDKNIILMALVTEDKISYFIYEPLKNTVGKRVIKVDLEDKDYEIAKLNKGNKTWKQVIMGDIKIDGDGENENEITKD